MSRLSRNTIPMKNWLFIFFSIIIIFPACKEHYTPKPKGYFRIKFPEKSYTPLLEKGFPYHFEIPAYSEIAKMPTQGSNLFDMTITVPEYKADIHLTYKEILVKKRTENLDTLIEDARTLAYKHAIKADAIDERVFMNPASKVYGTIYLIRGNVASPMQFYLTDSVRHFLRGAFYIREIPNTDSLKPVIGFIEPDIIHLIETTTWN
jgi:gliding motility-associated lipoprotein GldD